MEPSSTSSIRAAALVQPPAQPSVLVIDDSESVRRQVSEALVAAGFHVMTAPHGAAGLEVLAAHPSVSLIFCDVHMPVMDGLDFLESLSKSSHKNVSVLMLTAERAPQMILQARKLGAKGWLKKPFEVDMIVATARKILATG